MGSNALLEAALAYAEEYHWPVFPCQADKTPYIVSGVINATTNLQQIRDWWDRWPRANIGLDVGGAGMMVLDLDPGYDPAELSEVLPDIPATHLKARTPRGGEHLFFELQQDEIVPPSASKVAKRVDVRSFHSYVLLAPSRTSDGSYTWDEQQKPAFRTNEMVRLAAAAKETHRDRDNWIIEPDLRENKERAIKWLREEAKLAIDGQGGDHTAYATAAMMKSFGISEALAFDLMWEHWNPRCLPPWRADEVDHLEQKVKNGYSYNTSPPGNCTDAYQTAKASLQFKRVVEAIPAGRSHNYGRFRFVDRAGAEFIRPPTWLVDNFLPQGGYGMLIGTQGTFKTFIALDVGLTVCTGATWPWTSLWPSVQQGPVLFCVGEGRPEFAKRVKAWEQTHWGGDKVPNLILSDPVPLITEQLDPFLDGALDMSPDGYSLVILDTVGRAMQGVNENAQEHASAFTGMVQKIQYATGATVLALHHSGHDSPNRARGSSVFGADVDTLVRSEREDKQFRVKLHMPKQKDAAEWINPVTAVLKEVELPDGSKSLTIVKPEQHQEDGQKRSEELAEKFAKSTFEIIDNVIARVLADNRLKDWSSTDLAEAVAMQHDVDLSSKSLKNKYFPTLREQTGSKSNALYNPMKKRWQWRTSKE